MEKELSSSLEEFAKKVFNKLIEDGSPPIPYNYKVYFLNELDKENEHFKKQVYELISIEENDDLEDELKLERKLKLSYKYSKELLNHIKIIYKLNKKIKDLIQMQKKEVSHIINSKDFIASVDMFKTNLEIVEERLAKEIESVKKLYAKNVEILKEIESNSIYDEKYGVFNKSYFISEVEKELSLIKKFHHRSSIIMVKFKDKILDKLSLKSKVLVNRSLAKIMLKTSRRTDVVAKFDENIFAMLLKHTDIIGAQKTVERLADTILNSSIFLEGEEIELEIVAGVCELKEEGDVSTYILNNLETLKNAEKNEQLYAITKVN